MNSLLHPRHFTDIEIPVFEGKPLTETIYTTEYEFYLNWLADHLYHDNPDEQDATADALKNRQFQARCLGDSAFYHFLYYVEPYEWYMSNGTDYDTVYKKMEKQHAELYPNNVADDIERIEPEVDLFANMPTVEQDDSDDDGPDPFEYWINPEIWENALREYQGYKNTEARHADMGYRKELAEMLTGIKKHEDRYSILDNFYWSYNEEASK